MLSRTCSGHYDDVMLGIMNNIVIKSAIIVVQLKIIICAIDKNTSTSHAIHYLEINNEELV